MLLFVVIVLASQAATSAIAEPSIVHPVPAGYTVLEQERLGDGLTHTAMVRTNPDQRVHVAHLAADSPLRLRTVLSNDAIAEQGERLETTSSMCLRVSCLVAVNADFYADGQPVGGLVMDGALARTPNPRHHQLMIGDDGRPSAGTFAWKATLVSTDLEPLTFDAVNRDRALDQLVLYTPEQGGSTGTNEFGVEIPVHVVEPAGPLRAGRTAVVRLGEARENAGDTHIPPDGAVVSGHGKMAAALLRLAARTREADASDVALLRVETVPGLDQSVGGTPILVRDGARWFADPGSPLYRFRHPRTMAGWTAGDDVLLVTVDGRQPGTATGMTMTEAANLMIALGAVEAINLDGGGSTTFVAGGRVANLPSDRAVRRGKSADVVADVRPGDAVLANVERQVSVALAVVSPGASEPAAAAAGADLLKRLLPPAQGAGVAVHGETSLPGVPSGTKEGAAGVTVALLAVAITVRRRIFSPGRV